MMSSYRSSAELADGEAVEDEHDGGGSSSAGAAAEPRVLLPANLELGTLAATYRVLDVLTPVD